MALYKDLSHVPLQDKETWVLQESWGSSPKKNCKETWLERSLQSPTEGDSFPTQACYSCSVYMFIVHNLKRILKTTLKRRWRTLWRIGQKAVCDFLSRWSCLLVLCLPGRRVLPQSSVNILWCKIHCEPRCNPGTWRCRFYNNFTASNHNVWMGKVYTKTPRQDREMSWDIMSHIHCYNSYHCLLPKRCCIRYSVLQQLECRFEILAFQSAGLSAFWLLRSTAHRKASCVNVIWMLKAGSPSINTHTLKTQPNK